MTTAPPVREASFFGYSFVSEVRCCAIHHFPSTSYTIYRSVPEDGGGAREGQHGQSGLDLPNLER